MKKKTLKSRERIACLTCDALPFTEPKSRQTAHEKVLAPMTSTCQRIKRMVTNFINKY